MVNYLKCLIFLLFVGNLAIAGEKKVRCVIRGKLIGMEAKEVLLVDATVDSRYHGTYVPVEDGRFKYVLELPHVEGYKLIFVTKNPRVWYTVPFIVENGKLHITVNVDKSYGEGFLMIDTGNTKNCNNRRSAGNVSLSCIDSVWGNGMSCTISSW